jgi:acid phosphatase type 7
VLHSSRNKRLTLNSRESARRQPRLVLEQRTSDPMVVWAAGDICDDSDRSPGCAEVGRLIAGDPQTDHFLALGDLQYESGELANFLKHYDPALGAGVGLKNKTWPAIGNHEYLTEDAAGYFDYWGSRAGERDKGYYAQMLGSWRLLVTNTNCSEVGGCDPDSPQGRWLAQELADAPRCTVVVAHDPAISDGVHGSGEEGKMIFDQAYDGGAEILLSGHDHVYQRFAPMNKSFELDQQRGVRQFVSGAGGKNLTEFEGGNRAEYRQNTHAGALRLVLDSGSYSWQFRTTDGKIMDSGSSTCH